MILVDTAPLVALCDPTDGLHATALGICIGYAGRRSCCARPS